MKTLDLNAYGVSEMNQQELVETDGGFIIKGLIIIGVGLLMSGCIGSNNKQEIKVEIKRCGCPCSC